MVRMSNVAISVVRLFLGATWLAYGFVSDDLVALCFGFAEFFASGASVVNSMQNTAIASGVRAWLIPVCYLSGALFMPSQLHPSVFLTALAAAASAWVVVCVVVLGVNYSNASPVFVAVRSGGPFGFVRHPMALGAITLRLCLVGTYPTLNNAILAVAFCGSVVASVLLEEFYLSTWGEYREYSASVRWRLLPGVF